MMGRPPRPIGAGATYHLTTRGNDQQPIFVTDHDRHAFLAILARVCRHHRWTCHGYCLMGNHVHLAVTTAEGNLPAGMCQLNGQYARSFNRTHERTNHLFGHRYHSVLIQTDGQLLATIRYIYRNPTRAGIVDAPDEWPWSSYSAALGLAPVPDFVDPTPVLSMLDAHPQRSRALLRQFIEEVTDTEGHHQQGSSSRMALR